MDDVRAIDLSDPEPVVCPWNRPDLRHGMVVHSTEPIIVPVSIEMPCGGSTNASMVTGRLIMRDRSSWPQLVTQLVWPKPVYDWQMSRLRIDRAGKNVVITLNRHSMPVIMPGSARVPRAVVVED